MEDQIIPNGDGVVSETSENQPVQPVEENPSADNSAAEGEAAALAILIALVPLLVFTFFGQIGIL